MKAYFNKMVAILTLPRNTIYSVVTQFERKFKSLNLATMAQ